MTATEHPVSDIKKDPFIQDLLSKLPASERNSFSDPQLLALKAALGARHRGSHHVDLRTTFPGFRNRWYLVFLLGKDRRHRNREPKGIRYSTRVLVLYLFLSVLTATGFLLLYLLKSAMGINLIPGFSLGIWAWFKSLA